MSTILALAQIGHIELDLDDSPADARDQGRGLIPGGTDGSRELEPCRPGGSGWAGASDGFEVSLGGPIARDKFWFYTGYSEFDDAYSEPLVGGDPYDISLFDDTRIMKLNLQASNAHSFNASWIGTPTFRNYASVSTRSRASRPTST